METQLDKEFILARQIAYSAHKDQYRNDNSTPYIFHVIDVAQRVSEDKEAEIVAWLHDVLEDSDETESSLIQKGIPKHLVECVKLLTRDKNQPYKEYIQKIKDNPLAKKVKIADMLSNMSDDPTEKQIVKYSKAFIILLDK